MNYTNAAGNTRVVEFHSGDSGAGEDLARGRPAVREPQRRQRRCSAPTGTSTSAWATAARAATRRTARRTARTLLGKLLSIDVDGGDPKPQIAAIGLRNPWRFSFSPDGKQIWIGDVGQNAWEEIDRAPFPLPDERELRLAPARGARTSSPTAAPKPEGYIGPVFEYSHDDGGCSVTGGVQTANLYLFGDYCSGQYWAIQGDRVLDVALDVPAPVSFGEDGAGNLLARQWRRRRVPLTPN